MSELLPAAARYHALNEQVGDTYRSEGTFAAMQAAAAIALARLKRQAASEHYVHDVH